MTVELKVRVQYWLEYGMQREIRKTAMPVKAKIMDHSMGAFHENAQGQN